MYNSYWSVDRYGAYDPFYPDPYNRGGLYNVGSTGDNCYNPHVRQQRLNYICQPTTGEMKVSIEDLRNYVINLEANRKLEDLSDVEFDRPVQAGDVIYHDASTGNWELTNYMTGGEW